MNADGTPSRRGGARTKSRTSPSLSPDAQNYVPVLFREGKTLTGFIIAEHDVSTALLVLVTYLTLALAYHSSKMVSYT